MDFAFPTFRLSQEGLRGHRWQQLLAVGLGLFLAIVLTPFYCGLPMLIWQLWAFSTLGPEKVKLRIERHRLVLGEGERRQVFLTANLQRVAVREWGLLLAYRDGREERLYLSVRYASLHEALARTIADVVAAKGSASEIPDTLHQVWRGIRHNVPEGG